MTPTASVVVGSERAAGVVLSGPLRSGAPGVCAAVRPLNASPGDKSHGDTLSGHSGGTVAITNPL